MDSFSDRFWALIGVRSGRSTSISLRRYVVQRRCYAAVIIILGSSLVSEVVFQVNAQ